MNKAVSDFLSAKLKTSVVGRAAHSLTVFQESSHSTHLISSKQAPRRARSAAPHHQQTLVE